MLVKFEMPDGGFVYVNAHKVTRLLPNGANVHIRFDELNYVVVVGRLDDVAAQLNAAA